MVIAIILLAAALVLMVWPKEDVSSLEAKIKKDTYTAELNTKHATRTIGDSKALIASETWSGSGSQVTPTLLNLVTKTAVKHAVQVSSVRPSRTIDSGDLTQLGYIMNVTGAFPDVLAFARELDKRDSRIAVENLEIGASDETTDNVIGTIGVMAYMLTPVSADTSRGASSVKKGKSAAPAAPKPAGTTNGGSSHVKA